ncbi:MAG: hypothetical protein ACR2P3_05200 [Geminicoccaceae bacterium]
MANIVPNIAKGRVNELMIRVATNDPANSAIVVLLLKASVSDAALRDFDDLRSLLADGGNTEADFTNYRRKVLTDSEVTAPTPDDDNDRQDADLPDLTFANAGGDTNNNLLKLIVAYDPNSTSGNDADIIPLSIQDFRATTDGNDLTATINPGFFRAA